MPYLLALDQSGSSVRSIIFSEQGQIVAMVEQELPQLTPLPGWVEQDPMAIWQTQLDTLRKVVMQAHITPDAIHAIGINFPPNSTVVWNHTNGQPIYNAITGQDQRDKQWILDHVYNAYVQEEAGELVFGTLGSWILWQLTGHTEATPLDANVLGMTRPSVLGIPIPVTAVAESSHNILFGQACFSPDIAVLSYGDGNHSVDRLHWHTGQESSLPSWLSSATTPRIEWQASWQNMAALQITAFQTTTLLRAVERKESNPFQEVRVSGIASQNDLLLQMQADLLGISVKRPAVAYPCALGAAYLAGLQSGLYRNTDAISAQWKAEKIFHPTMSQSAAHELMAQWERALHQVLL